MARTNNRLSRLNTIILYKPIMCYVIITSRGLAWFLLSMAAAMALAVSIVTPEWLIASNPVTVDNYTKPKYASVGIYTRCKKTEHQHFHCGAFDHDGFGTDSLIYPTAWKFTMFFISLGFFVQSLSVVFTLLSYCKQSVFGKSIHTVTGAAQMVAGIIVMISLFCYPLAWNAVRVKKLCSQDSEAFMPADCSIGSAMYAAIAGVILCFLSGGFSLIAESGNLKSYIKRRIEDGEKLVCVL